jgi:hypothetical protein
MNDQELTDNLQRLIDALPSTISESSILQTYVASKQSPTALPPGSDDFVKTLNHYRTGLIARQI